MPAIHKIIADTVLREVAFDAYRAEIGIHTRYGITARMLENHIGRQCTAADVDQITRSMAEEIFYRKYYIQPEFDRLPEMLQPFLIDTAVDLSIGPKNAITLLQIVLKKSGNYIGIADGRNFLMTQSACHAAWKIHGNDLIRALVASRVKLYRGVFPSPNDNHQWLEKLVARAESFKPQPA